jgi:hypothetical protein
MNELAKKLILTQLELFAHQIKALQSMIIHLDAPSIQMPVASPSDPHVLSEKVDEEIGRMFDDLKPNIGEDQ